MHVVQGTFHQGDVTVFSAGTAGKQCMANALVSIAYSQLYKITTWNVNHLDSILREGDHLYGTIHACHELLQIDDFPRSVKLFDVDFDVQIKDEDHLSTDPEVIRDAVTSWLSRGDSTTIVLLGDHMGASASAIIVDAGIIHFFDSHSRAGQGLPHPDGTSTLCAFASVSNFIDHIQTLVAFLHPKQISLHSVAVHAVDQTQENISSTVIQQTPLETGRFSRAVINCVRCNQTFTRLSSLNRHMKTCDKQHHCQHCGKEIKNSHNLKQHEQKCKLDRDMIDQHIRNTSRESKRKRREDPEVLAIAREQMRKRRECNGSK